MTDAPESPPKIDGSTAEKNKMEDTQTRAGLRAWLTLVGGTVLIVALVTTSVGLVFNPALGYYELVLVIALTSYFPLTYLSYRHFRGKVHRARVQDDFRLLGIGDDEGKLDEAYRTEMVNRSLADTLRDQFQAAEMAGTDLADVPAERLGQVLDSFGLTPQKVEALFKGSPDSLVGLGRVYIQRGQPQEAIRVLNQVIAHNSKHAEAHSTLGWAEFSQQKYNEALGHFETALALFDEAIERNPPNAGALNSQKAVTLNRKGITLLRQRQHDQALTAYDEAITLNDQYASAYFNRGHVKRMLGRFKEAIDDFNQALTHEPDRTEAYLERGAIFLDLGDIPEALTNFSQAVGQDRGHTRSYFYRGNAYLQAGDHTRALYDLDTALDIDPKKAGYYWLRANIRRKLEDYDAAVTDCTQALRLNVDLAPAYETRARLHARQGRLTEAIADFERYLERDKSKQDKIEKHIALLKKTIRKREREVNGRGPAAKTQPETAQAKT